MILAVLAVAVAGLACGRQIGPFSGVGQQARSLVPAIPPNSVPDDVTDTTKWVSGGSDYGETIVRDIILLHFRPGTPQADRQAAVDLVNGTVAGGRRWSATDGLYFIRVPAGGSVKRLLEAVGVLRELPQVATATLEAIYFFDQRG